MTNDDAVSVGMLTSTMELAGRGTRKVLDALLAPIALRLTAVETRLAAVDLLGKGASPVDVEAVQKLLDGQRKMLERIAALERPSGNAALAEGLKLIDATLRRPVVPIYDDDGKLKGAQRI